MAEKPHLESFDAQQLESLRVFHSVASSLTTSLDLDTVLRQIMKQMEHFFEPEQWALLLVDEESGDLVYKLAAGGDDVIPRGSRVPRGQGMAGRVMETGEMLRVDRIHSDPAWSHYAEQHPELGLNSIAAHPIRYGDRILGVLSLNNAKLDRLPKGSLSFLSVLCNYAAIALHNAAQVKLIHDLSITDDCTGLFNARYLYQLIQEEIAAARPEPGARVVSIHPDPPRPFSLLFLDLDHFKSINDANGHQVGTRLLSEIGGIIKRTLGPNHAGFRYGGDEFVALLRGLNKPAATELAQRLRHAITGARFLTGTGMSLSITGSFGLATFPEDGDTPDTIIRSADAMMYVAKDQGRDRIAIADSAHPAAMPVPKTSRHSD
jgi:diguanylate cyclase (GGDEF)-like protein